MTQNQKAYNGIDVFKLVAAFLVILLHAIETTAWYPNEIKFVATRFAVPFFFIASGFFFYKGLSYAANKRDYFIKYEKNLLKLFLLWGVLIYFPSTISTYSVKYDKLSEVIPILIRRIFIIGSGPYWYLVAMLWAAAFIYISYKERGGRLLKIGIAVGFVLQFIYVCLKGISGNLPVIGQMIKLTDFVFSWEFNFIMYGIPFMGIGFLIGKKNVRCGRGSCAILFTVFTLIRVFEYNLPILFEGTFWDANCISFSFIGQAVSFFLLAKETQFPISNEMSKTIRKLSTWFYLTHAIVLYDILDPLLDNYTNLQTYSAALIAPKIAIVVLVSFLIFVIIIKIDNKYLNILINE